MKAIKKKVKQQVTSKLLTKQLQKKEENKSSFVINIIQQFNQVNKPFSFGNSEDMNRILEQDSNGVGALYVGNLQSAQNINELNKCKIGAVLSVGNDAQISYQNQTNINHKQILIRDLDHVNIIQYLDECIVWIEEQRKLTNLLVHCYAGVSRSPSIVIGYLIKKNHWNFEQTMQFMQKKRKIYPNQGFIEQLKEYSLNYI